jgi:hypothetical protein
METITTQALFDKVKGLKGTHYLKRSEHCEVYINGDYLIIHGLDFDSKVSSGSCPYSGPYRDEDISNVDATHIEWIPEGEEDGIALSREDVQYILSLFDYTMCQDLVSTIQSDI